MREQRDRISKEIMNLSPEEIVEYFERRSGKVNPKPSAFFNGEARELKPCLAGEAVRNPIA